MVSKEFIKNSGIYIFVSSFSQGGMFLLWILLAWWLRPSEIGLYTLALFIVDFFSTLSTFGLDFVITRFYYYYKKAGTSFILSNIFIIFLFSSAIISLLFFFSAPLIPIVIPGLSNLLADNVFLFLAIIFTNSLANLTLVHYTTLKQASSYAKLQWFKITCFVLLSLIFAYNGFGIFGLFYALLVSSLILVILFIIRERAALSMKLISGQTMKEIISYGAPLMLYSSSGIVSVYFSRILLDRYNDLSTLGVYTFFLTLSLQINGGWGSFNKAWTPEVFSRFSNEEGNIRERIVSMVFLLSFAYMLVIALVIISGEFLLFKLLFKQIYLEGRSIFYILLIAPLFTSIYTATYPLFYYEKETKRILGVSFFIHGINAFLTFFMIKFFSQTGAAISFSTISMITALVYLLNFKNVAHIPSKIITWTLFLTILMSLNIAIFLKTSSVFLFLLFIFLGAISAYKIGRLNHKLRRLFHFFTSLLKNPFTSNRIASP